MRDMNTVFLAVARREYGPSPQSQIVGVRRRSLLPQTDALASPL